MLRAEFLACRVSDDEAWAQLAVSRREYSGFWGAYSRIVKRAAVWLGLNAVLALFAAVLLDRRIARPVARVAAASVELAEGGDPAPVPARRGDPREVSQLVNAFNEMAAKLKRSQAAERNFLLSVTHEFKTPLTVIRGYGETLTEGRDSAEQAGPAITREANRLERLVHDVLELGRTQRTTFNVRHEPFDLAEVTREAARRFAPLAHELGVDLLTDVADSAFVSGDADRALQIIGNLGENALRSTPSGGEVAIGLHGATVTVHDTGLGLSAEECECAFERFYLYERYGADRRVGTGLGLAIVRELADAMGANLRVESRVGEGTTFSVEFPPVGASDGVE